MKYIIKTVALVLVGILFFSLLKKNVLAQETCGAVALFDPASGAIVTLIETNKASTNYPLQVIVNQAKGYSNLSYIIVKDGETNLSNPLKSGSITIDENGNGKTDISLNLSPDKYNLLLVKDLANPKQCSQNRFTVQIGVLKCGDVVLDNNRRTFCAPSLTENTQPASFPGCPSGQICVVNKNTTSASNTFLNFGALQALAFPNSKFSTTSTIGDIISKLLPYIFVLAGLALLLYLIYGGFQFMFSQGDPKAAQSARSHITNALIGFVIIFIAFWAVQIFGRVLNLRGIISIFK